MKQQAKKYLHFLVEKQKYTELLPKLLTPYLLVYTLVTIAYGLFLFLDPPSSWFSSPTALTICISVLLLHCVFMVKTLNDHYSQTYCTHLAFYGIHKRDIRVLSLLLLFLPSLITSLFVLMTVATSDLYSLSVLIAGGVLLVSEITPLFFLKNVDGQVRVRQKKIAGDPPLRHLSHFLLSRRGSAYLYKDLKTTRRLTLWIELPVSALLSLVILYLSCVGIIPYFCSFFSYIVVLFAVINAAFEVEYNPISQYHRRWYRICYKELVTLKSIGVILASLVLLITHILMLLSTSAPIGTAVFEPLYLVLALLVVRCVAWIYAWCLEMCISLNSITELLILIATMLFPIGVAVGLIARRRLVRG